MGDKIKRKFKKEILEGKMLPVEELLRHSNEFVGASLDALKDMEKVLSNSVEDGVDEMLKLEREFEYFQTEPETFDHVSQMRSQFFEATSQNVIDARIAPILARASKPKITMEQVRNRTWYVEDPHDNEDGFWHDEEDSSVTRRRMGSATATAESTRRIGSIGPNATVEPIKIEAAVDQLDLSSTLRYTADFVPIAESTHADSIGPIANNGAVESANVLPVEPIKIDAAVDQLDLSSTLRYTADFVPIAESTHADSIGPIANNAAVESANVLPVEPIKIDAAVDQLDLSSTLRHTADFVPIAESTRAAKHIERDGDSIGLISESIDRTVPNRNAVVVQNIGSAQDAGPVPIDRVNVAIAGASSNGPPDDASTNGGPPADAINRVRYPIPIEAPPVCNHTTETPDEVMRIPNVQVAGLNIPLATVVPVLPVQAVASGPQRAVAQEPDPDLNVLIAQISAAQITGVQIADEQDSNVQVRDVHVTGQEVLEASDPDVQVGELEIFQNYVHRSRAAQPTATVEPSDESAEFDEVEEAMKLLRDVVNHVPTSKLFERRTADLSAKSFMLFCNMWSMNIFAVDLNRVNNTYTVTIA